jgi:hypothetical protein
MLLDLLPREGWQQLPFGIGRRKLGGFAIEASVLLGPDLTLGRVKASVLSCNRLVPSAFRDQHRRLSAAAASA